MNFEKRSYEFVTFLKKVSQWLTVCLYGLWCAPLPQRYKIQKLEKLYRAAISLISIIFLVPITLVALKCRHLYICSCKKKIISGMEDWTKIVIKKSYIGYVRLSHQLNSPPLSSIKIKLTFFSFSISLITSTLEKKCPSILQALKCLIISNGTK